MSVSEAMVVTEMATPGHWQDDLWRVAGLSGSRTAHQAWRMVFATVVLTVTDRVKQEIDPTKAAKAGVKKVPTAVARVAVLFC